MSFLNKLSALNPFSKKEEVLEYFFALNISSENLTSALWTIDGKELRILETSSAKYTSLDDIPGITDKLLDQLLGIRDLDVQKILFGVPSSWLTMENLKDEYLKVLKSLVKELDLTPMAYVEGANALVHILKKTDGVPPTAILVGFEEKHLTVTVVRAGKLDGVKIIVRGEDSGIDIEKALLTFTNVETLPSRILIYGSDIDELKNSLLSFSWMSKLSFLHFPKIDSLAPDIEIKSVCLAGASEIKENILYAEGPIKQSAKKSSILTEEISEEEPEKADIEDFGFVVGDVAKNSPSIEASGDEEQVEEMDSEEKMDQDLVSNIEEVPIERETAVVEVPQFSPKKFFSPIFRFLGKIKSKGTGSVLLTIGVLLIILGAYLFFPKADIKVYVEPKILKEDAQVTADPAQKTVDEERKIIPGQIVQTEVSGTDKASATGKKQIGDSSTGTVKVINNSSDAQNFSKGSTISYNNIKFTLDSIVNIASTSATSANKSTSTVKVTAVNVGADGNLPSGTQFSGLSSQVAILAEGNFAGGTSKEVTVVSSDDQQRLLAQLSSSLRQQAQQKLQDQYKTKKILQEALLENVVKKSFDKGINDQASELLLNLTVNYKGTAFDNGDLRTIVSKLVTTQVPDGFLLDLSDAETQADVSKLEKDGKLIFLARFKAKLLPKIDTDKIKNQIKGKSLNEAVNIIKSLENVLGSEISITPKLPDFLQRIPFLEKNIKIEVGLK